MVCTGRILAVSYSPTTSFHRNYRYSNSRFLQGNLKSNLKWRSMASEPEASSFASSVDSDSSDKNSTGYFQPHIFFLVYILFPIGRKIRIGKWKRRNLVPRKSGFGRTIQGLFGGVRLRRWKPWICWFLDCFQLLKCMNFLRCEKNVKTIQFSGYGFWKLVRNFRVISIGS